LSLALQAGVEFTPGTHSFYEPFEGESFIRLNFASHPEKDIELGIKRLGSAMEQLSVPV